MEKAKKKNKFAIAFAKYKAGFGLRQALLLILIAAAIVLIVGLSIPSLEVIIAGAAVYSICSAIDFAFSLQTFLKNNRRSPQAKRAIITMVLNACVFALAVATIVYTALQF